MVDYMAPIFYRAQARHAVKAVYSVSLVLRRRKTLVRTAACLCLHRHDGRHLLTMRALLRFSVLLHSFIMPSLLRARLSAHPFYLVERAMQVRFCFKRNTGALLSALVRLCSDSRPLDGHTRVTR